MAIPAAAIDEVRERADLLQVVGRFVNLKRQGPRFVGLCPFHGEKTPSFSVNPDRQIFYCFGCGAGGDVFTFRMRHDGLDFIDAVRSLADEYGVLLEERRDAAASRSAALYRMNELALDYFRHALRSPEGAPAREYLDRRGVPADLRDRFQIGFAPPGWDGLCSHLREERASFDDALRAGLIAVRENSDGHYDRFRGRIVFPIREPAGRLCGFGARALADETPKYLNSPESPVYHKGRALFALDLAIDAIRQTGRAIVVEGYFDLVALHRAGLQEGVAPCGTALSVEHARRLRRYCKEVALLFDGDDAGRRAAERSLPTLLGEGLRVRAAWLPAGHDPDTLLATEGEAALRACVESAAPLLDEMIERAAVGAHHPWQKADALQVLAPALRAIQDPLERASYLHTVAERLGVRASEVESALGRSAPSSGVSAREPSVLAQPLALDPISRELAAALCAFPALADGLTVSAFERLPEAGRDLLSELLHAIHEHGERALPRLLGPDSGLAEPAQRALLELVSKAPSSSREEASQALWDSLQGIQGKALESEAAQIRRRLVVCSDPEEEKQLLERMQRIVELRRERVAQPGTPTL